MGPGVDVNAATAAQLLHQVAVHDAKFQTELVAHLIPPVDLQTGGADNQDGAYPVADDKLLNDQTGLDCLTQAHVVGNEQVGAGHLDGAYQWVKLIIFNINAAAKGGLEGAHVG